ncbi:hypothetical protein HK405_005126, partial [Cladochytrium tenue]
RWVNPDHPTIGPAVESHATACFLKLLGPAPGRPLTETTSSSRTASSSAVVPPATPSAATRFKHVVSDSEELAYDSVIENAAEADARAIESDAPLDPDGPAAVAADAPATWDELDVVRHIELYFALCSKKHELLSLLFERFGDLSPSVARAVLAHVNPLMRSMAASPDKLLARLHDFPAPALPLARRVVAVLTEKGAPSRELVEVVMEEYSKKSLDARFVLPVLTYLDKPKVLSLIPSLLALLDGSPESTAVVESAFLKLVEDRLTAATVENAEGAVPAANLRPQVLTPIELLVAIHNQEGAAWLKKCLEGTAICLAHTDVFKQEVFAAAIQQLVDQPRMPALLMKTVLSSLKTFPGLVGFATGVLARLVGKKVWATAPDLWEGFFREGFIRCCLTTLPASVPVVASLPRLQLEEMLAAAPVLKKRLVQYTQDMPQAVQARAKTLLAVLSSAPDRGPGGRRAPPPLSSQLAPHQAQQQQQATWAAQGPAGGDGSGAHGGAGAGGAPARAWPARDGVR